MTNVVYRRFRFTTSRFARHTRVPYSCTPPPHERGAKIRVSWRPVLRQLFRDISLTHSSFPPFDPPFLSIEINVLFFSFFFPFPTFCCSKECNDFPLVQTFLPFSQRKFKNYKYKVVFLQEVRFITWSRGYGVWIVKRMSKTRYYIYCSQYNWRKSMRSYWNLICLNLVYSIPFHDLIIF